MNKLYVSLRGTDWDQSLIYQASIKHCSPLQEVNLGEYLLFQKGCNITKKPVCLAPAGQTFPSITFNGASLFKI